MEVSPQESSVCCGARRCLIYSCKLCPASFLGFLFTTLVGVLASVLLRGTTLYVLMVSKVLLLTIYSNTGSSSDPEE